MSKAAGKLSTAVQLMLYRRMFEVRRFEQKAIELYNQSLIHGTVHVHLGEEATAAGVVMALQTADYVTSTHRGHGHALVKGARLDAMFAELLGRETGTCKGRGGSMHIADVSVGMLGANGIVGGSLPLAVGAALSAKMQGKSSVVACFFGDAASNQGTFHESINLAAIWKLPVLFVCENNGFGVSTRIEDAMSVENVADRARAYGIPGITLDGQDVEQVYTNTLSMVERARAGEGPCIIECKTHRYEGHNVGDPGIYRTKEEVDHWKKNRDPITLYRTKLAEAGLQAETERIEAEVEAAIQAAIEKALAEPTPDPRTVTSLVYADDFPHPDLSGRRTVYMDQEV